MVASQKLRTVLCILIFWCQTLSAATIIVNVMPGDVLDWSMYQNLTSSDTLDIVLSDPNGAVQIFSDTDIVIYPTVQCNGTLRITSDDGHIVHWGTIVAPQLILEASNIMLMDLSVVNASSANAGGNLYIGGGWQGADPTIHNAMSVNVSPGALLSASALTNGDGGIVVLWSEIVTALREPSSRKAQAQAAPEARLKFQATNSSSSTAMSMSARRVGLKANYYSIL